jgi:hypothetical protein
MQVQIFPRGTYAPTMGVFAFAQDPRAMADNIDVLLGSQAAPVASSSSPSPQFSPASVRQRRQREPQFSSAAHFASLQRSASPPVSQSSHSSSSVDEASSSDEGEYDGAASCNLTVSGKLSRAFKSLRKLSGNK